MSDSSDMIRRLLNSIFLQGWTTYLMHRLTQYPETERSLLHYVISLLHYVIVHLTAVSKTIYMVETCSFKEHGVDQYVVIIGICYRLSGYIMCWAMVSVLSLSIPVIGHDNHGRCFHPWEYDSQHQHISMTCTAHQLYFQKYFKAPLKINVLIIQYFMR